MNSRWSALGELAQRFGDAQALALCRAGEESVARDRTLLRGARDRRVVRGGRRPRAWRASEAQVGRWAENVITADRLGMTRALPGPCRRRRCAPRASRLTDVPRRHLHRVGATVQPARLARGMRRVLLERGVRIFEQSPVTRFGAGRPRSPRRPAAPSGPTPRDRAERVGRRTGSGSAGLLIVRGSYIVLTAPAPDKLEEIGWTGRVGLVGLPRGAPLRAHDAGRRIAFGVGGMQPGLARPIGPRFAYDERAVRIAAEDLYRMFPALRGRPDRGGVGRADRRRRPSPPVRSARSDPGNVHYGHGYTGNGVGPSHLGGRLLARRILGKTIRSSTCRSSPGAAAVPAGADPFARRARREHGDPPQGRGRGSTARSRTRSSTSSRSSRAASATTSARSRSRLRRTVRSRARRAATGSPLPRLSPRASTRSSRNRGAVICRPNGMPSGTGPRAR